MKEREVFVVDIYMGIEQRNPETFFLGEQMHGRAEIIARIETKQKDVIIFYNDLFEPISIYSGFPFVASFREVED